MSINTHGGLMQALLFNEIQTDQCAPACMYGQGLQCFHIAPVPSPPLYPSPPAAPAAPVPPFAASGFAADFAGYLPHPAPPPPPGGYAAPLARGYTPGMGYAPGLARVGTYGSPQPPGSAPPPVTKGSSAVTGSNAATVFKNGGTGRATRVLQPSNTPEALRLAAPMTAVPVQDQDGMSSRHCIAQQFQ